MSDTRTKRERSRSPAGKPKGGSRASAQVVQNVTPRKPARRRSSRHITKRRRGAKAASAATAPAMSVSDAVPYKASNGHTVTPNEAGLFFEVVSGRSGKHYKVLPMGGTCECEAYKNRLTCSHLDAVNEFARLILERKR